MTHSSYLSHAKMRPPWMKATYTNLAHHPLLLLHHRLHRLVHHHQFPPYARRELQHHIIFVMSMTKSPPAISCCGWVGGPCVVRLGLQVYVVLSRVCVGLSRVCWVVSCLCCVYVGTVFCFLYFLFLTKHQPFLRITLSSKSLKTLTLTLTQALKLVGSAPHELVSDSALM